MVSFLVVLAMILGLIAFFVIVSNYVEVRCGRRRFPVTASQVDEELDAFHQITPSMLTKFGPEKWVGAGFP